jgi:phosphopantothenoylcysteine decarboxylase/phosphopantothenate--cysteine ligase
MKLSGKKILLGVCGSIAAYKSVFLTRLLVKEGAEVKVILTNDASNFVSPLTFSTLSKNKCYTDFTSDNSSNWNNHVDLALWADIMLIAPATANTIAKMANGLCDNYLLAVYMSTRCPIMLSPAMDEDMWKHFATQKNIETLRSKNHHILPIGDGELASGLIGEGRMAEPNEILEYIIDFFQAGKSKLLGKKILITAGPTYEPIDPVRFVGNHSSGKMGIALAEDAANRGALVTLILGPSSQEVSNTNIKVHSVVSGAQMLEASEAYFNTTDVCIFAAAVADYRPENVANQKIKKDKDSFEINMVKSVDIAKSFGEIKKSNQISVGFALETENEEFYAQKKLASKNFDFIVLNSLNDEKSGFKFDTNKIKIIDRENNIDNYELKDKKQVAKDIINKLEKLLDA